MTLFQVIFIFFKGKILIFCHISHTLLPSVLINIFRWMVILKHSTRFCSFQILLVYYILFDTFSSYVLVPQIILTLAASSCSWLPILPAYSNRNNNQIENWSEITANYLAIYSLENKRKNKKKITLSNDVRANKERFCFVYAGKFFQGIAASKILAQQTLSSNAVEPQPYLQLSIRNYIFGEIFVTFNFIVCLSTSLALVTQKYLRFTLQSKHKPYTYHKKKY